MEERFSRENVKLDLPKSMKYVRWIVDGFRNKIFESINADSSFVCHRFARLFFVTLPFAA